MTVAAAPQHIEATMQVKGTTMDKTTMDQILSETVLPVPSMGEGQIIYQTVGDPRQSAFQDVAFACWADDECVSIFVCSIEVWKIRPRENESHTAFFHRVSDQLDLARAVVNRMNLIEQ